MSLALDYWIATVGPRQAQLWHCWRAPGVQWLAQEQVVLTGTLKSAHRKLAGANGKSCACGGSPECDQDFAHEAAAWLIQAAEADGAHDINVIAPEPVLLRLRDQWSDRSKVRIHEHIGDLSELPSSRVAQHPVFTMVRGLAGRRTE